jgi:hypothetical protein
MQCHRGIGTTVAIDRLSTPGDTAAAAGRASVNNFRELDTEKVRKIA